MSQENKVDYPNEVVIPFLNPISEKLHILACENDPNAGNGRHRYRVFATDGEQLWETDINFQKGPLPQTDFNGILSNVLLQVLIDHLKSFQEGPFKSRETAIAITHLEEAENWIARRADKRSAQGILGQHKKEVA
jgi:hypothetical protein